MVDLRLGSQLVTPKINLANSKFYMGSTLVYPVAAQTLFVNNFSQYAVGAAPTDWTSRWVQGGFTAIVQNASDSLSGKVLQYSKTAANRQFLSWNAVPATANVEILLRFRSIESASDAQAMIGPLARGGGGAGAEEGYLFLSRARTTGSRWDSLILSYSAGTQVSFGAQVTGPTPNFLTNVWKYMRLNVVGSTLMRKMWDAASIEPNGWQEIITNSSVTASGLVGVAQTAVNPDVEIDYFAVDTTATTIPLPT